MPLHTVWSRTRLSCALVALSLAAACDGGGGGSGAGPSTPTLSLDKTSLVFSSDSSSAPPAAQAITATFSGAGLVVGTLPGVTVLPAWLSVTTSAKTSPAAVTVSISQDGLAEGLYTTTLRFATGNADGTGIVDKDVAVSYTINHQLNPNSLELSIAAGASGATASGAAQLITSGASWKTSTDQPWLAATPASGTGAATLTVTATLGSLATGTYAGNAIVTDILTGVAKSVAVHLNVEPRQLIVLERGVALSSTLGASRLSHSVPVVDTAGLNASYTAASDAAWLKVGAVSGTAGTPIALTADPTGLADGLYYANVTLSPGGVAGLAPAVIRAGFYVDHTSPAPPDLIGNSNLLGAADIVADPVRPYFYVSAAGFDPTANAFTSSLIVYNAYTGAQVTTLPFAGKVLGSLAIAPDGSTLLVVNTTDLTIVPVTLGGMTLTAGTPWTGMRLFNSSTTLKYVRVSGIDVVLTGNRQILAPTTGAVLGEFAGTDSEMALFGAYIAVAPDGSAAFLVAQSGGNHLVERLRLSAASGSVTAVVTNSFNETGSAEDVVVSRDGRYLLTLSGNLSTTFTGNNLVYYDTKTMAVAGGGFVTALNGGSLDVATNGDIYVTVQGAVLSQYSSAPTLLGSRSFAPTYDTLRLCRFSGDEQRAVVFATTGQGAGSLSLRFFSSKLP